MLGAALFYPAEELRQPQRGNYVMPIVLCTVTVGSMFTPPVENMVASGSGELEPMD